MKRTLTVLALATATLLVGCGTTSQPESSKTPIAEQHLVSTFKRNGIKLEWSCAWGTGFSETTCVQGHITAIEATGYASAFGSSETNREAAFTVAHDIALDKLMRFIKQDISSSRVTNTLTRNVEKANDLRRQHKVEVAVENDDSTEDLTSVRDNNNETVRTVTENIRSQAAGILRGVKVVDESIVDTKTVSVTVRWSKSYNDEVNTLRSYFTK